MMTREQLLELQNALEIVLNWSDDVRDQIAAWIAPDAAPKPGNGHDPHPPSTHGETSAPRPAKAPPQTKSNSKTAERKLLDALQGSAGMSISALSKATSAGRSTIRERLGELASRGDIEKGDDGLWRLKVGPFADPTAAPSS
jgi:hypothetical protein